MTATSAGTEQAYRFSSPQEEALITLMRSADCLHRAFQKRLKPFGLTVTQYNVLRILRGSLATGLTCSAIGRMMITPEPDITRLLARLKVQKFLRQERDRQDRRMVWTHISPRGLEVLKGLDEIVEQTPRDLLGGLDCGEVQELTRLLAKTRLCVERDAGLDAERGAAGEETIAKRPSPRSARLPLPPRPPE